VAVHLALSWRMSGPIIQGDEGSYLGTANLLARGTGLLFRQSPFQPGYGALLWPVERITNSPELLYRAALVLNALAMGSLVVVVYAVSRWLVDPGAIGQRVAVAAVVSAYPPFLVDSNVAVELSVFVPLCVLAAWAVGRCAERRTWPRWAAAGLLAGACYAFHALGIVVVVAVLVLALLARRPLGERLLAATAAAAGIEVALLVVVLLLHRIIAWDHSLAAPAAGAVVSRSQAVAGLYSRNAAVHGHLLLLVYEVAGQVWYLACATVGLAVVGGVLAARATWRVVVERSRDPGDYVATFAGLVAAFGLSSSANRFIIGPKGAGQADLLIYGRYNEHLLAPLLAVGAAYVVRGAVRWRNVAPWAAVVVGVVGGCGVVLAHGRSAALLREPIVFFNVIGLQPLLHALGRIDVLVVSGLGIAAAVAVLALAALRRPAAALAPLLVVAGLASAVYSASSMVTDSRSRADQRVVIHALGLVDRVAGRPRCVAYDLSVGSEWTLANDQTFRPRTEFKPFDSQSRQTPCSDLVVSPRPDLDVSYPGARLMALENYEPTDLWVLPGTTQDRLAAAGLLLPVGFPAPLPAGAYAALVSVVGHVPEEVTPGTQIDVRLAVTNRGRTAPWPSRRGFVSGDGWVSLAVAWAPAGAPVVPIPTLMGSAARYQLDRELWPGETDDVAVALGVGPSGHPLAPGTYRVTVALVQEGFSFFATRGDAPLEFTVTVR